MQGGLTLGGGMGWLARQYGLTCDNVVTFQVVTAEGEVIRASRDEYPDLFWGLRGGGNFAVVTGFEFRLHAAGTSALLAEFSFPARQAPDALRGWRNLLPGAPRQATFTADIGRGGASMTTDPKRSFGYSAPKLARLTAVKTAYRPANREPGTAGPAS